MESPLMKKLRTAGSSIGSARAGQGRAGGNRTAIIPATTPPSGVGRNGVKGVSSTTKLASPMWEDTKRLHAAGYISDEAFRKIAASREAILSKGDDLKKMAAAGFPYQGQHITDLKVARAIAAKHGAGRAASDMSLKGVEQFLKGIGAISSGSAWRDAGRLIAGPQSIRLGAAALLGGLGIWEATKGMRHRHKQEALYEEMHEAVPELRQEDPQQVQKAYSVLQSFAPSLAQNPVAAGQVTKQLVNMGNVADVQTVKGLADIQSTLSKTRGGIGETVQRVLSEDLAKQLSIGAIAAGLS